MKLLNHKISVIDILFIALKLLKKNVLGKQQFIYKFIHDLWIYELERYTPVSSQLQGRHSRVLAF